MIPRLILALALCLTGCAQQRHGIDQHHGTDYEALYARQLRAGQIDRDDYDITLAERKALEEMR